MAYCVHCGVKLGDAESCCPLCGTPVVDPNDKNRVLKEKAFPPHTPEQRITISRRFLISLYTVTMLIPAVLCLVINLLLNGQVTWSAYPAGALTLLYIAALVFTLAVKYKRRSSIAAAFVLLSVYIWMCERLSASPGWFFPVALPLLAFFFASMLLLTTLYANDKLGKLTFAAAFILSAGLLCLLAETLISLHAGEFSLNWSLFVAAPCVFISAIFFYINSYRPLREELRRRMHF